LGTGGYGDSSGNGGEYWDDAVAEQAVTQWLSVGGRRIDTSLSYGDQTGIGNAIKTSGIPRGMRGGERKRRGREIEYWDNALAEQAVAEWFRWEGGIDTSLSYGDRHFFNGDQIGAGNAIKTSTFSSVM
jgi:hypothetical protein